ncbi:hypothetical protein PR048_010990, partial [Dryococelus australis]
MPETKGEWLHVADVCGCHSNFPHCLGSVDGRICVLEAPINSEVTSSTTSQHLVLYCVLFVDVGCQGRISDATFTWKLCNGSLEFPDLCVLSGGGTRLPYVFVADNAFPLHEHREKCFINS